MRRSHSPFTAQQARRARIAIRAAGGCSSDPAHLVGLCGAGQNFPRTIASLARARKELRIVADQIGAPTAECSGGCGGRHRAGRLDYLRRRSAEADGLVISRIGRSEPTCLSRAP